MFFILSKVLFFLICPFSWIVLLLILALVVNSRKRKHRLLLSSVLLLFIFTNPFLLNQFANQWNISVPGTAKHYSCAILLGGFASKSADGHGYFTSSSDRFIQAVKLKTQGRVSNLLVSGINAKVKSNKEDWVLRELREFKIPDSSILIENRSRNTFENVSYSKIILERSHLPPPYLLVTSAFHMRRALFIFKKMGIDVVPYPCDYLAGSEKTSVSDFIPQVTVLNKWNVYIKELVGYGVYYLKARL